MFCGNAPCTCRTTAKKATVKPRAPRQPRTDPPIAESNAGSIPSSLAPASQKADVTAAMRAASIVKHQGNTIKEDHDAQDEQHALLDDAEWVAAIQAVEPLMHPIERKRFESVLEQRSDQRARAAAWKARIT